MLAREWPGYLLIRCLFGKARALSWCFSCFSHEILIWICISLFSVMGFIVSIHVEHLGLGTGQLETDWARHAGGRGVGFHPERCLNTYSNIRIYLFNFVYYAHLFYAISCNFCSRKSTILEKTILWPSLAWKKYPGYHYAYQMHCAWVSYSNRLYATKATFVSLHHMHTYPRDT